MKQPSTTRIPPQSPERKSGFLPELAGVALVGVVILFFAIPNLIDVHHGSNETRAIGALKTIGTAQSLFREADKEGDGNLDYGSLSELANAGTTGLIDQVLGSGTKSGYLFEATYSRTTSEFLWMATARPAIPGTTGDLYFATNQDGVTYYSTSAPFRLDADECVIPARAIPVGR